MNHIELFAGCGGLCLGLKSEKYDLLFANELSPMASETFAFNFFHENLQELAQESKLPRRLKTRWLSSQFELSSLDKRLRENPQQYPAPGTGVCDIQHPEDIQGAMVVGSIIHLNKWLSSNERMLNWVRSGFGKDGVDLVSGGPPCQSFSMAGMRDYSNARNILPWEFAKFVEHTQPRFALLENVSGILRPFVVEGKNVFAWFEVAKAFAEIGYVPLCLHVNAKFVGVAQNRPRFLMILIRSDVYASLQPSLNEAENCLLGPSGEFFDAMCDTMDVEYGSLPYFDVSRANDLALFQNSFLSPLVESFSTRLVSVRDAIDDLSLSGHAKSDYVTRLNRALGADALPSNTEPRGNTERVKRRFRIYQVLRDLPKSVAKEVQAVISGESSSLTASSREMLSNIRFLREDGTYGFLKASAVAGFLARHQTRKQTQKALDPETPAPAALSIPDDACHYDDLRTLSVREMARIQSFPDSFTFRSKVTTGGQNRKFEVPQYTQVGNAVPPLLGKAIGRVFKNLDVLTKKRVNVKKNSGKRNLAAV